MRFSGAGFPEWNSSGQLPAVPPDPASMQGSPYPASIAMLVERFGSSVERRHLLSGLLNFRAQLRLAGIVRGFQWIDGSFVEYIERNQGRAPNDIDVVTFFHIAEGQTQESLVQNYPAIFNHGQVRENYTVDAYFVPLEEAKVEEIIAISVYWYRLWSHTRDGTGKGYLQVDLAGTDDRRAKTELERLVVEGGQP